MRSFSQFQSWFLPVFGLLLSLLFLGFHAWLQFVDVPDWEEQLFLEQQAVQQLKDQQAGLMDAELRDFLEQYSEQVEALEVVLDARKNVFNGGEGAQLDPVVIVPVLEFFADFRQRLLSDVMINNLSFSTSGEVSFLIKTTSYQQAADQIEALRFDIEEASLFVDVEVGSVVQAPIALSQQDTLPEFLAGRDVSFDALIRMQMNPEYLWSSQQLAEDEEPLS